MPDRDQCPPLFRPTAADIARIAGEVAEVSDIQKRLVGKHKQVQCPDRLAHEYQIAGGRVQFRAAQNLPATLAGVGVFQPNENYIGIGRISTGLGTPHIETNPDMLGARLSFMTRDGQPIDFLALNTPRHPPIPMAILSMCCIVGHMR